MKNWIKEIICIVLSAVIVITPCLFMGRKLMPQRYTYGSTWNRFLFEEKDTIETLFVGPSVLYASIDPVTYEEVTGEVSYDISGPELTIPQAYYYIKEVLKTQSPKNIYIDMTTYYNSYSEYNMVIIGYMPVGINRLMASINTVPRDEILENINPLYSLHQELESLTVFFEERDDEKIDEQRGFAYLSGQEGELISRRERTENISLEDLDFVKKYLLKIEKLCKRKGINLLLYFSPERVAPNENDIENIKEMVPGVRVIDFNEYYDDFEFMDWDWYDNLHLNCNGAYKFTVKFSEYLDND